MASIFDKEPERKVEKLKYLIGKLNTHRENSNNNKYVKATLCIDKHKLLNGFTGKLHFVFPFVK